MSGTELERLMTDLRNDPDLMEKFDLLEGDADAWMRLANASGYGITRREAEELADSYGELSDEELEQVAGGWTAPRDPP